MFQGRAADYRGVATGVYGYLYPPKTSAHVNFLWRKNDARTVLYPQKLLYPPKKQISGYAPGGLATMRAP